MGISLGLIILGEKMEMLFYGEGIEILEQGQWGIPDYFGFLHMLHGY